LQNGESLQSLLAQQPFAKIVAANRIGTLAPSAPVLLYHSQFDDVIPYAVGTQLKADWCGHGASVDFVAGVVPTHVGGMPEYDTYALPFLNKIFHGQPVTNDC
ncbi:MAG: lipase family protein, partial [Actinomycetota bacterium]|nr:lipase family protein [Actinomycetota bacterium]